MEVVGCAKLFMFCMYAQQPTLNVLLNDKVSL